MGVCWRDRETWRYGMVYLPPRTNIHLMALGELFSRNQRLNYLLWIYVKFMKLWSTSQPWSFWDLLKCWTTYDVYETNYETMKPWNYGNYEIMELWSTSQSFWDLLMLYLRLICHEMWDFIFVMELWNNCWLVRGVRQATLPDVTGKSNNSNVVYFSLFLYCNKPSHPSCRGVRIGGTSGPGLATATEQKENRNQKTTDAWFFWSMRPNSSSPQIYELRMLRG